MNAQAISGLNGLMQGMTAMTKATAVISAADNYRTAPGNNSAIVMEAMSTMKSSAALADQSALALKEANPDLGAILDIVT